MKSSNKGPQMSRMGQGALGPEGRRAADVQSEPPPSATERGSLQSTDKRRVTVLPKRGFRRRKDVRARCARGTDDPRYLQSTCSDGRAHTAIRTGEPPWLRT